jgi:hypothetical protein
MRKRLGTWYFIEEGVYGFYVGFARSTGFGGKKMLSIAVIKGTPHIFGGLPIKMTKTAELPTDVVQRYRLSSVDFIMVDEREPSWSKAPPSEKWEC